MRALRARGFLPSGVFMRYQDNNRIEACSTKNRRSWLSAELFANHRSNNLNFHMAIWRVGVNPFANLGSEFRRCISGNSPGTIRVPLCDLLLFSDAQSRPSRILDRRFPALRSTQMSFALTFDHSLGRPGSKLQQQKTLASERSARLVRKRVLKIPFLLRSSLWALDYERCRE